MIIKNFGMGPRLYIKDPFNIFDAVIVMLSIIDVIVTYALPGQDNTSKGPITAFRAFRLLRVFKLSKSWKKLHYLLSTIGRALREISSFSVLLFLLVFIYVLLGMELFAKRNNDTKSNSMSIEDYVPEPRLNFDNFFNGFILIFTILTGESWDVTMLQFATSHGFYAIYFFMSFIIIGVMIFLNLFLAILLENFDEEEKEEEDNELANLSFS
jgi:voltage-dependent calcium channel L type alpha-1D